MLWSLTSDSAHVKFNIGFLLVIHYITDISGLSYSLRLLRSENRPEVVSAARRCLRLILTSQIDSQISVSSEASTDFYHRLSLAIYSDFHDFQDAKICR
jgi:hypothetical protein